MKSRFQSVAAKVAFQAVQLHHMGLHTSSVAEVGDAIVACAEEVVFQALWASESGTQNPLPLAFVACIARASQPFTVAAAANAREHKVQTAFMGLLTEVAHLNEVMLRAHDTHAHTPLLVPLAKINVSFTGKPQEQHVWANLVFFLELKTFLEDSQAYYTGVYQLRQRACDVFEQQPDRQSVVAALASASQIEFWRFERDPHTDSVGHTVRTPRQPLAMELGSEGYVPLHSHGSALAGDCIRVFALALLTHFLYLSLPPSLELSLFHSKTHV